MFFKYFHFLQCENNKQLVSDVERNGFSPPTLRSALLTGSWCQFKVFLDLCVHA